MTEVLRQKRVNILFSLVHGFLPWSDPTHLGFDHLSLLGEADGADWEKPRWALCCGHVLSPEEADAWCAEGLLIEGRDRFDRRALFAGPLAPQWLRDNWPSPEDAEKWL